MSWPVYEVEVKLPIDDAPAWANRLNALTPMAGAGHEHDTYFAHPTRDFATTDEALRLRDRDGRLELTYKGPREDATAKIRKEWNLDVKGPAGALIEALGFRPVAAVIKHRRTWHLDGCAVTLDDVDGVGTYLEVEATGDDVAEAQTRMEAVVAKLDLTGVTPEPRSYLELQLSS